MAVTMKFFCVALLSFTSRTMSCTFSVGEEEFDLTPLVIDGSSYQVKDNMEDNKNVQHTYWFNFCDNIDPPQTSCENTTGTLANNGPVPSPKCSPQSTDVNKNCVAPVFQTYGKDVCYRLAKKFQDGEKPTASFYAPKNPAKGVQLLYTGGDQCGVDKEGNPRLRKFMVNIICDAEDTGVNIPDDEPIYEKPICEYRITINSIHGCPTACGTLDGKMCNDQGECGYDTDLGKSRCFCYKNHYGDTCESLTVWNPVNTSAIVVMSLVAVALLAGLIVFTILVWHRVKGLRLDPEAYSSMGGDMTMKTEDMETLSDEGDEDDDV